MSATVVGFRQAVDRGPVVLQTDDCLVGRLRAGDDAAFEAIYDRYARGVFAFCVHMLGSRESAEDALQLTFVSAYRALRGGEGNISLRPWLYTIARNCCLSELRTRRYAVDVDGVAIDRPCVEGLADQVQRREELREMLEDMQRLPADQRAALVLFELGDHPHKEIAAVLGVRVAKVKALIFQAREALVRGRQARDRPCVEIRGRLAALHGRVLPRSMMRAHIDRCPSCAAFEGEVRRQRAALALILPVTLTGGLKASVLVSALRGGGAAAAGAGACGSGAVVAGGATAAGGVGGASGVVAGGATAAGGAGAVAAGASAAASVAAGTGAASTAVIAGGPSVAAVATGLTAVGADYAASAGLGGLGATGVLAKILTAAAVATGGAGAIHASSHAPHPLPGPAAAQQLQTTSAWPGAAPTIASNPAATPSPATATTSTPAATPSTPAATPSTPAATPSTPAAPPSAATATTSTPAAPPSTATATTSTPAAPPSTPAATPSTPAAPPSTPAATTSTPAAPPSTATTTTTAAPSPPGTATPPNDASAATDLLPDSTTAQATVDATAPTAATSG
ncbi:MAG: RNA polymerase sigma factor [Solirubrobacteraceae bacterium]